LNLYQTTGRSNESITPVSRGVRHCGSSRGGIGSVHAWW